MNIIHIVFSPGQITRLIQAVSISREPIAELTREMHEDPEKAMKELDVLQKKLGMANKVMCLRTELDDLERDLQEI